MINLSTQQEWDELVFFKRGISVCLFFCVWHTSGHMGKKSFDMFLFSFFLFSFLDEKKRNRTSEEKVKRIFVSDVGCEKEFQTFVGET